MFSELPPVSARQFKATLMVWHMLMRDSVRSIYRMITTLEEDEERRG